MNRHTLRRRSLLAAPLLLLAPRLAFAQGARATPQAPAALAPLLDRGADLAPLRTVLVAHDGATIARRGYRGHSVNAATNIKSASKSVVSALVGIAIDKGVLTGTDQKIAPLLRRDLPKNPDPRMDEITLGHLLSMQAGLERTSGAYYGRWIASSNWVRAALSRPFVDDPGGSMLYSTGSTHLLSAILTRQTGRSTLALAREWLGPLPGFAITSWERDPQGIYFGGNQMAMSPASLLAFGELYRNKGKTPDGRQLISPEWIARSWEVRTQSRFTGDGYGYGWFSRDLAGQPVHYAWGYGGQMLYIAPTKNLSIVMTSDTDAPAGRSGHRDDLHALAGEIIAALG